MPIILPIYNLKIFSQKAGLKPVTTKTGLRPQKTAVFGLLQSWSSILCSGMKADWSWSQSLKIWPKDQTGPDFQALDSMEV